MKKKWLIISIFTLSYFLFANSSYANVENDFQNWDSINITGTLPKNFKYFLEAQSRVGDNSTVLQRILLRPALGYQVTPHLSLWQGFGWTPTFYSYNNEFRSWQQALLEYKWKNWDLKNRTRLEQRFIDGTGGTSVRLRDLIRASHPIGHSEKWSWLVYDELFLNLDSVEDGPQTGFDQNRIFLGFNWKKNQHLNVDLGYMNNYLNVPNNSTDILNHNLVFSLNINI